MIVPANDKLLREYYGGPPLLTSRSYVYLENGKPVAVAGFIRIKSKVMIGFSEARPDFYKDKRKVVAMYRHMLKIADENGWTVIAEANPELPTAPGFLKHIGFTRDEYGRYIRCPQWQGPQVAAG